MDWIFDTIGDIGGYITGPDTYEDDAATKINTNLKILEYSYKNQDEDFKAIITLSELREELEQRITAILSDYTQLINQVAVVSTLTLGMATSAFGSLLGNTDGQPEWKSVLFSISCVVTVCLSILSVIESFFLGAHINQVEARFAGGVYPHINNDKSRIFQTDELKFLNAKFNFIVVTFFSSFLSFSTTLLGTMYIGLGLSNNPFVKDNRIVKGDEYVLNNTNYTFDTRFFVGEKMSNIEPSYVYTATTMTTVVCITYFIILYRFLTTYSNHISGKSLLRFLIICGCMDPDGTVDGGNLNTPIEMAAGRFNELQINITDKCQHWMISANLLLKDVMDISKDKALYFNSELAKATPSKNIAGTAIQKLTGFTSYLSDNYHEYIIKNRNSVKAKSDRLEVAYACKNYISMLQTNIYVVQKYMLSENAEPAELLSYKRKAWANFVIFVIIIWGVTGAVVVTLLMFLLALVLNLVLRCCCRQCFRKCKLDDFSKTVVNLTTWHFDSLYRCYKNQVKFTNVARNNSRDKNHDNMQMINNPGRINGVDSSRANELYRHESRPLLMGRDGRNGIKF